MKTGKILQGLNGIMYGTKNIFLRATTESLQPKWLWFGVTDRCNSRCVYCDIWHKKPTKDVLTPEEIEKTLRDPLFRDVEYILNSGGEPTLRQDLKEIILAEHRALPKARLQLSTNGLLPERVIDVVKFAIQHDIDLSVGTSLDAIGDAYDSIRGVNGNFRKVDWLLHELVALKKEYGYKQTPTFGFTLTDQTLPFLEEVKTYAQKLGVNSLVQWYNQSSFYGNTKKDLTDYNKSMIKAVQSLPYGLLREMWLKWIEEGYPIKFRCFAMYTFCVLKCNGDISPCLSLWDVKVGNVRESSPTTIWHSNEAKKARKIIKKCQGCLNVWGAGWSLECSFYPYLLFYLNHPHNLVKKLTKK